MMMIFGAGFAAVSLIFVFMYLHAWRRREHLQLNELERFDTRISLGAALINICVGVTSILVAWIGGPRWTSAAGMVYPIVLAPGLTIYHSIMGNRRRKLEIGSN